MSRKMSHKICWVQGVKKGKNNNRIICDEIYLYIIFFPFSFVRWCKVRFLLFDLFDDFEMSIEIKNKKSEHKRESTVTFYDLYSKVTKWGFNDIKLKSHSL